jgi:tRNA-2-methylthio-N6-dimethylallyladenosine synthase
MNRRHSRAEYVAVVARFLKERPDMALTSDFIVGFPGETEREFVQTLSIVDEVGYADAFSFKYSPRPGTPAADQAGQVDETIKAERLGRLQAVINNHKWAFIARSIGQSFSVLFEKPGKLPGQIVGRSPFLQPVHVNGPPSLIGQIASVVITSTQVHSLFGDIEGSVPDETTPEDQGVDVAQRKDHALADA